MAQPFDIMMREVAVFNNLLMKLLDLLKIIM